MIIILCFLFFVLTWLLTSFNIVRSYFYGIFSITTHYLILQTSRTFYIFTIFSRWFNRKAPKGLPTLGPVEKVSERVYRVSGLNPGSHTLQGTNTYLVGKTSTKILIDTGEDITKYKYVPFLFDSIFPLSNTTCLSSILLTHGHGDHQGGVKAILNECKRRKLVIPKVYKRNIPHGNFPAYGFDCHEIHEDSIFHADDETTILPIFSPGHTDDHVAFILKEDKALFSGDCVLGCGTAVFDDLYEYMKSLEKLRDLMISSSLSTSQKRPLITNIYPGHGPIIRDNALQKVDEYISHRKNREKQVITSLQKISHDDKDSKQSSYLSKLFSRNGWMSTWELVNEVYGPLPALVKMSAQWNLTHHLEKLRKEDMIDYIFPGLWRIKKGNHSINTIDDNKGNQDNQVLVCDDESCRWIPTPLSPSS